MGLVLQRVGADIRRPVATGRVEGENANNRPVALGLVGAAGVIEDLPLEHVEKGSAVGIEGQALEAPPGAEVEAWSRIVRSRPEPQTMVIGRPDRNAAGVGFKEVRHPACRIDAHQIGVELVADP